MIIEICGPPGVGKTTLAHALWSTLFDRGLAVELASSYRPSECPFVADANGPSYRPLDPVRRLIRPAREILSSAHDLLGFSREVAMARRLTRLMPPRNILWSIRLRQYIWRFSQIWYRACKDDCIVIFDQAFVQVVCSLVLLTAAADRSHITKALDAVPKPDLLVRLHAPKDVLAARLVERERRQTWIERQLELDRETNLRSVEVLDEIFELLQQHRVQSIDIKSADMHTLSQAVQLLESAVLQPSLARVPAE